MNVQNKKCVCVCCSVQSGSEEERGLSNEDEPSEGDMSEDQVGV